MINLQGKRILVTGASSGIGKAFSIKAASLGASLVLWGRNTDRLRETYESLNGNGHEYHSLDITDHAHTDQIEQTILNSTAGGKKYNGFVHSAGIEKTLPYKSSTRQVFRELFEINVFAGFEIARILSKKDIIDPAGASFVFLSSVMGKLGSPGKIAYCSSKSALLAGVRAMALELAAKKIRCNCVLPGIVISPMSENLLNSSAPETKQRIIDEHPLGLGTPDDVASLLCFLISDQARWITGSEYVIDGGYSAG